MHCISSTEARQKAKMAAVQAIYEVAFPTVALLIQKKGGTLEEVKDIFHDAVLILWQKDNLDWTKLTNKRVEAYLVGICKNLWRKRVRFEASKRHLVPDTPEPSNSQVPLAGKVLALLEKTSERCLRLLRACYFGGRTMSEVASDLGYTNAHSASVQKYKCLGKLKNVVIQKKLNYEDFLE